MIVNRIAQIAHARGKNVRELSNEMGVQYNTVLNLFRGQGTRIDLETLDALCRVLQVQPGDLFQWRPDVSETKEGAAQTKVAGVTTASEEASHT